MMVLISLAVGVAVFLVVAGFGFRIVWGLETMKATNGNPVG